MVYLINTLIGLGCWLVLGVFCTIFLTFYLAAKASDWTLKKILYCITLGPIPLIVAIVVKNAWFLSTSKRLVLLNVNVRVAGMVIGIVCTLAVWVGGMYVIGYFSNTLFLYGVPNTSEYEHYRYIINYRSIMTGIIAGGFLGIITVPIGAALGSLLVAILEFIATLSKENKITIPFIDFYNFEHYQK